MRHGHAKYNARTPTYRTWQNMVQRCTNQNHTHWEYYGGRGITVCERWLTFDKFLEDMGSKPEGLTLDRINNDGNYELSNCRWATRSEQNFNRRRLTTTCPQGHEYTPENTYVSPNGSRFCRTCKRARGNTARDAWRRRQREARAA